MRTKTAWLAEVIAATVLGFALVGSPMAQTTSTVDVRKFEVISVDGNKLVVRDQKGTNEYTVPDDFRFTVDGKQMAASELKAGMKGTATVTTRTSVTPVTVTQVKEAEVLRATDTSVTVRGPDGVSRRFTRGEINARGIQLVKEGKSIQVGDLHKGDKLTATVVTSGPPKVLTEKEVQMTLDEAKAEAAAKPAEATAAPAPTAAATQAAPAAAAPQPTIVQPTSPYTPVETSTAPAGSGGLGTIWYLLIGLLVAGVMFFVMRGSKTA